MICNSALIRDELDADEARERFRIAEGRGEAALATWARQWGGALMDACFGDAWQSMVSDLEEAGKEVRDTLDAWERDTLAAAAEQRLSAEEGQSRVTLATDAFTYLHLLLISGIVIS